MPAARPVILTCAITGSGHTPTMSPHLPYTVEDVVEQSIAAAQAGASVIHLHARDPRDGSPTADPEVFLVGGGVSRAGEVLFKPLAEHYKTYAFRSCRETPIKQASLGNDAGIYGAVRLIVGA